ncbi:MAG: anti-sigma factor antagonist [Clostridia bacterium]|nr:anti-sigma factor antagonist [Clostridia bacterium]
MGSIKEKRNGQTLTVTLKGEIDHHSAVKMRSGIDKLLEESRPSTLILDLGSIEFMDSSGLGLIMGRYKKMNELGGELIVCNPSDSILKIFRLAGLGRFIKIQTK